MQWSVKQSDNAEEEIAAANWPKIRLFTVARKTAEGPIDDCEGSWAACTPETVPGFTAVGYFFGRDLRKALKVPVGLIHTSWGGSPAEVWIDNRTLDEYPDGKAVRDLWGKVKANYEAALKKHNEAK